MTIGSSMAVEKVRPTRDDNRLDLILPCVWSAVGLALTALFLALGFGADFGQALMLAG